MCGRYTLQQGLDKIEAFLNAKADAYGQFHPTYNAAPSQNLPVAYRSEEEEAVLEAMYWGFIGWPPKSGERPFSIINTRDDKIPEKPMWHKAVSTQRCIIPISGFYEWKGPKGKKTPYYIHSASDPMLGLAGIYSNISPWEDRAIKTYSIITTAPNAMMKDLHNRMPAILHPTEFEDWLDPQFRDASQVQELIRPYPDDALAFHEVSRAVGNVRNDNPELIQAV